MNVTCYTDASYDDVNGGGWALWAKSDLGRKIEYGKLPSNVKNSVQCELAAILIGLHVCVTTWPGSSWVEIKSDCLEAVKHAKPSSKLSKKRSIRRFQLKIRRVIRESCDPYDTTVDFRWVPGHNDARNAKGYLNRRCDALANVARELDAESYDREILR